MVDLNAKYKIVNFTIGDTKAGTKMGKLQLKNVADDSTLNCILWEETLNRIEDKMFRAGNIVKLTGASYNEKFNNCLVSSMELIEEGKIGLDEDIRDEYYEKIIGFVKDFKNEKIKNFTLETLEKNKEKFKIAPAAKAMHHNYLGGLVCHTLECVEFAQILAPKLNGVNHDELFCACILHDIGKIFEYNINLETGLIEYNDEFSKDWISHSQYAFALCMGAGLKKVAKMIAAHHGRADWGAMIDLNERDLEPFYYAVHHIDDLSAKFGKTNVSMI